jgi:hypothetical protein
MAKENAGSFVIRFGRIFKDAFTELSKNDPLRMAGATAFFTTFALPPILIIIIQVLGLFFDHNRLRSQLFEHLTAVIGRESVEQIIEVLMGFRQLAQNWPITIAGFVFLLFVDAIHGNKSQPARQNALANFKSGRLKVLVATDIAARGIDIDDLTHVINFDLPNIPESYVHRIGRTGRAGASGIAFSFCDADEMAFLKDINKLIGQKIPAVAHLYERTAGASSNNSTATAPAASRHRRPTHNGSFTREKVWNSQR